MIKAHDLRKLCGEFLSIPPTSLPLNEELLEEALISECIRIVLYNSQKELHILSLKNWVLRKLRCIISDIVTQENDKFNNVLKDGKGPTMEFVGDIITLSRGYYIPAPTRVVNVDKCNWILVSGYPTKLFIELGFEINIEGMSRMIINVKETDFIRQNIPTQSFENYVGLDDTMVINDNYFDNLINMEEISQWDDRVERESYDGKPDESGWGFENWGKSPLYINYKNGDVSLWREEREFYRYDYWLKIREKVKYNRPQIKVFNGEKRWVTSDFLEQGIRIQPANYKLICIALDILSHQPRVVNFLKNNDDSTKICMNFTPPAVIVRWLHAIGANWEGYSKGTINWRIENYAVDKTKKIMETIGLKVIKKKHGR